VRRLHAKGNRKREKEREMIGDGEQTGGRREKVKEERKGRIGSKQRGGRGGKGRGVEGEWDRREMQ